MIPVTEASVCECESEKKNLNSRVRTQLVVDETMTSAMTGWLMLENATQAHTGRLTV